MKFQKYLLISVLFLSMFSFQSCVKDKCELTKIFYRYDPVYMTKSEMRAGDLKKTDPIEMENTGKIYFYNNYIFVNEMRKGVHIIDNVDPENPVNIAFLEIPGNTDISIKNNVIYAQSFLDLWTIDMTDPVNPVMKEKTLDVFLEQYYFYNDRTIVDYIKSDVTQVIDCTDDRFNVGFFRSDFDVVFSEQADGVKSGSGGNSVPSGGLAGSFARMRIVGDYLYSIDNSTLSIFSINGTPNLVNTVEIGWNIETLFPYQDKLFIGSTSGMYIFDNSDPVNPTKLSEFWHMSSCDPVFVKGNKAYVTLRSGNKCQGFTNQLEILDITDLKNPTLIKKYDMDNPHGLSIAGNTLFLCDGASGLKVYDIEKDTKIKELDSVKDIDTYDVISLDSKKIIFVIGKDGLYQFDVSDPKNVKEISFMGVKN